MKELKEAQDNFLAGENLTETATVSAYDDGTSGITNPLVKTIANSTKARDGLGGYKN